MDKKCTYMHLEKSIIIFSLKEAELFVISSLKNIKNTGTENILVAWFMINLHIQCSVLGRGISYSFESYEWLGV